MTIVDCLKSGIWIGSSRFNELTSSQYTFRMRSGQTAILNILIHDDGCFEIWDPHTQEQLTSSVTHARVTGE